MLNSCKGRLNTNPRSFTCGSKRRWKISFRFCQLLVLGEYNIRLLENCRI